MIKELTLKELLTDAGSGSEGDTVVQGDGASLLFIDTGGTLNQRIFEIENDANELVFRSLNDDLSINSADIARITYDGNVHVKALHVDNAAIDGGTIYFDAGTTEFIQSNAAGTELLVSGFTDFAIAANLIPNTDTSYTLGTAAKAWQELYLDRDATHGGTIYFDGGTTSYLQSSSDGATLTLSGFTTLLIDETLQAKQAGIGGSKSTNSIVRTGQSNPLGGALQYGELHEMILSSDATTRGSAAVGNITTDAAAFTCTSMPQFYAVNRAKGAGSTITRKIGFLSDVMTDGANNASFTDNESFTGDWGIHLNTSNPSHISGYFEIANQADPGAPTAGIRIGSIDTVGEATATLALRTEQAVEAIGTFTASNKLKVSINNVEYWLQLDAV